MMYSRPVRTLCVAVLLLLQAAAAHAAIDAALLKPLASDDLDVRIEAVLRIAVLGNDDARKVLQALNDDALAAAPDGTILILDAAQAFDPASGRTSAVPDNVDAIVVNNRLRGALESALSGLKLLSLDRTQRLGAALALQAMALEPAQAPLIRKALASEHDGEIGDILRMLVATLDLQSPDAAVRKAGVSALADSSNAALRPMLQAMLVQAPDGSYAERDVDVRVAAAAALRAIDNRITRTELVGNLFYGVSLASVLLLAAMGLAITFGLMGIINMAHGELLMIGAYTTYVCQGLFRTYLPGAIDLYLVAAVPAAFLVAGAVGMALERSVSAGYTGARWKRCWQPGASA